MAKRALFIIKRPTLHDLEARMGDRVKHLKDHARLCDAAETHLKAVRDAETILISRGYAVTTFDKEDLKAGRKRPKPDSFDLVVAVGGDGTFSTAAHHAGGKPLIAVNSDTRHSEGGLACCAFPDFARLLDDFIAGKARIVPTWRAEAELDGKHIGLALNEVFVGPVKAYHTARYVLRTAGLEEEQKSSGLIICTGSGSGAWYKSAGGRQFPPGEQKLAWLVREPYQGRLTRCTKVQGFFGPGQEFIVESKMYSGMISIDGQTEFPFERGSTLKVRIAAEPLQVVKPR
jgi:NAD kinase